ncbi:MAG: hypothetical protein M1550_01810 [Deltaproteobacteria bacterium]|nr:hypothetical protein [Deltaproteobacteria bacterium]
MDGERLLALKIDVDTRRGMEEGVPSLLSALGRFGVRGTFFLSFGPDNSGQAVYRLLGNPRFLFKMVRTNAPGLYGVRTALYGTILPAPMMDRLPRKDASWIREWLDRGLSAYAACLGHPPRAFGAPGWVLTGKAVEILSSYRWDYLSCTRASGPFLLSGAGVPEIPSDLPCLEEVGGPAGVPRILAALSGPGTHVLPVHAEVEGGAWREAFDEILDGARERGYRIVPLSGLAARLREQPLPERPFRTALLKGRAFPCAV